MFGGTFDPVHMAHVVVATETRAALGLDRVLLVVAGDPWQKRGRVVASAADRLMLVQAAVDGVEGLEASAIEIERGEASVTADTLEALAAPQRELFLILGADAVANMSTWRRLEETRDWRRSSWSSGPATRTPSRPARAGGWSGSRSRGSTSRRPCCVTDCVTADRSTGWYRRRWFTPFERAGSTLTIDDDPGACRLTSLAPDAYRRAAIAAQAAADKKGDDIVVLDVGDIISIAEVFVLVSATNTRLVKTIVDEIEGTLHITDDEGPAQRRRARRRDLGADGLRRPHRPRVPRRRPARTTTSIACGPTPRASAGNGTPPPWLAHPAR